MSQANFSRIRQCIEDHNTNDPSVGLQIKQMYGNRFELLYITVEKLMQRIDRQKAASETAKKYLNIVEKNLKKYYKERINPDDSGDIALKFKMISESENTEPIGYYAGGYNGSESYYFRLIRQYEITSHQEEDTAVPDSFT